MRSALAAIIFTLPLSAANATLPKMLWHEPSQISLQHWICGPAPCDQAPAPPFHFEKRDKSGTNPKITVKDARGRTWDVKFGAKVIPECFGARYVTALGYLDEPSWFVASGVLQGTGGLKMHFVSQEGRFTKARFQPRGQPDFEFLEHSNWLWSDNPFRGTREMAGLKILIMLLSNWDNKDGRPGEDSNDAVFRVRYNGQPELFYGVFDWGAGLGRWGHVLRRDKGDCTGYTRDTPHFVRRSAYGLDWGFEGKHTAEMKDGVTVADIRWLLGYLRRITPEQLRTGLKASGATDRQTGCWSWAIEERVKELEAVAR